MCLVPAKLEAASTPGCAIQAMNGNERHGAVENSRVTHALTASLPARARKCKLLMVKEPSFSFSIDCHMKSASL